MNILTKTNWNEYIENLNEFAMSRRWAVNFNVWNSDMENILIYITIKIDNFGIYKNLLNKIISVEGKTCGDTIKRLDKFLLERVCEKFPELKGNDIVITHFFEGRVWNHNLLGSQVTTHLEKLIDLKCIHENVLNAYNKGAKRYDNLVSGYLTKI